MEFNKENGEIFIPDNTEEKKAVKRTTHMAIGAHQDDLETMAYDGIQQCYKTKGQWFMGVVVTDGSGSPRSGKFSKYTDEQMKRVRRDEQKQASKIGRYGSMVLLDYPSDEVRDKKNPDATLEIKKLIVEANPRVVYMHNLLDKKDTHVAVAIRTIAAIRMLPKEKRPEKLYGCEVWRDLDWMRDEEKIIFDVGKYPRMALRIIRIFRSQVAGGKRYDLAAIGRRRSNATYTSPGNVDTSESQIYAMDLTPLMEDDGIDIMDYAIDYAKRFIDDAKRLLKQYI